MVASTATFPHSAQRRGYGLATNREDKVLLFIVHVHNRDRGTGPGFVQHRFDVDAAFVNRQPTIEMTFTAISISLATFGTERLFVRKRIPVDCVPCNPISVKLIPVNYAFRHLGRKVPTPESCSDKLPNSERLV